MSESELQPERYTNNDSITDTAATPSTNINISDLDEETNKKLKGDTIGDTLYSQSFVLKTLLKFSDFEWNDQFEEDLCFLWDMTLEKDVCTYLFNVSYPSLACVVLEKTEEPRCTEILIGILANILCAESQNGKISDQELNTVLKELDSADPLILLQVMRFLSALAHSSSEVSFIDEEEVAKIRFIMNNSVNKDLLGKSLETVAKLTADNKLNYKLVNVELYKATLTAYHSVLNCMDEYSLDCREKVTTCRYMLEIICNICTYVDKYENYELLLELQRHSNTYVNEVLKILHYFSFEENLLPVTDEIIFFISVFRYTLTTLNINFTPKLFKTLCKIILIIIDIQDDLNDMFDVIMELMCYLISCDHKRDSVNIIEQFSKIEAKVIINSIKNNQHKYEYKIDIQYLICEYSK